MKKQRKEKLTVTIKPESIAILKRNSIRRDRSVSYIVDKIIDDYLLKELKKLNHGK